MEQAARVATPLTSHTTAEGLLFWSPFHWKPPVSWLDTPAAGQEQGGCQGRRLQRGHHKRGMRSRGVQVVDGAAAAMLL
jgi:hypothetical protein